mgnify:CR=1 FL=1
MSVLNSILKGIKAPKKVIPMSLNENDYNVDEEKLIDKELTADFKLTIDECNQLMKTLIPFEEKGIINVTYRDRETYEREMTEE